MEANGGVWPASCYVVSALNPDEDADETERLRQSRRQRLDRIVNEGSDTNLVPMLLDLMRALCTSYGLPEYEPTICGDTPEAQRGRILYVADRFYLGNKTELGPLGGMESGYVRTLKAKKRGPSDKFLLALGYSTGIRVYWLKTGEGEVRTDSARGFSTRRKGSTQTDDTSASFTEVSLEEALTERLKISEARERSGVSGEYYVLEQERLRLTAAGCLGLAKDVRLMSEHDPKAGYDILSFSENGDPIHIEVKSTKSAQANDKGFWLSENERLVAERDSAWCVFRVWNVADEPHAVDLGNVVSDGWLLEHASWRVSRAD